MDDISDEIRERQLVKSQPATQYVTTENLLPERGGFQPSQEYPVTTEGIGYKVGDILISNIRPYLKKIWLATHNGICSSDIVVIRPRSNVTSSYLYQLLSSDAFFSYVMSNAMGTKMPRGDRKTMRYYPVSFPNQIEVQIRITDALFAIDRQLSAIQQLLAKYESIKKTTVKLLMMPGDNWKQYRIGDVCPLQRGFDLPHSEQIPGDYPVICSNGISGYNKTYMVKGPGVVTGRSGTIGKVHYIDGNFWPHNTTLWVTKFVNVIPRYAFFLLKEMDLAQFSGGTGVPTLNRNDIHDAIVSLPSISIQKEIVTKLVAIDSNLKEHMQELSKIQQIKQSMLRYFFG